MENMSYQIIKNNVLKYKGNHPHKDKHYNNRSHDPFHTFCEDCNRNGLEELTPEVIDNYFQAPECYDCHDMSNCPISEDNSICKFNIHNSFPQNEINKWPCVETKRDRTNPYSILLSRPAMTISMKHGFKFIFRATRSNGIVIHHNTLNRTDDRMDKVTLQDLKFHLTGIHRRLDSIRKEIKKLEIDMRLTDSGSKRAFYQRQIINKRNLIYKISNIEDDPQILDALFEIQDRIRLNMLWE